MSEPTGGPAHAPTTPTPPPTRRPEQRTPDTPASPAVRLALNELASQLTFLRTLADESGDGAIRSRLAQSLTGVAGVLVAVGNVNAAADLQREGVETWESIRREEPGAARALVLALFNLGSLEGALGRHEPAAAAYTRAVAVGDESEASGEAEGTASGLLAADLFERQGEALERLQDFEAAASAYERAIELCRQEPNPDDGKDLRTRVAEVATLWDRVRWLQTRTGHLDQAIAAAEQCARSWILLSRQETARYREAAAAYLHLAELHLDQHDTAAALKAADQALDAWAEVSPALMDEEAELLAARTSQVRADVQHSLGDTAGALASAEAAVRQSLDLVERMSGTGRDALGALSSRLSILLVSLGNRDEALLAAQAAVSLFEELTQQDTADATTQRSNLVSALTNLAHVYQELDEAQPALETSTVAVEQARSLVTEHADCRSTLVDALRAYAEVRGTVLVDANGIRQALAALAEGLALSAEAKDSVDAGDRERSARLENLAHQFVTLLQQGGEAYEPLRNSTEFSSLIATLERGRRSGRPGDRPS